MIVQSLLIVEDVPEAAAWLGRVASTAFPGSSVDQARNLREAFNKMRRDRWDMALVDLGLPDGSGLDIIRRFQEVSPETICIVSTVLGDDAHIVSALSAGAQGYILKGQAEAVVRRQLIQLQHGIPALSPTIARRIMEHFQRTGPTDMETETLTMREADVLAMVAQGLRNTEVARALGLADSTVATHVKNIYRKLGISSRAEAAVHATRMGLT
ncbi:MAG: DNA-binding response regulator [Pelagibacterium sp. SCN 64-44]|nr:MAG: DNA-binding response regulator [Pelagibacterium sp. SCN 64-44]